MTLSLADINIAAIILKFLRHDDGYHMTIRISFALSIVQRFVVVQSYTAGVALFCYSVNTQIVHKM